MNAQICNHFDNLENLTLNNNAAISPFHKFGTSSLACYDMSDSLSYSNHSGSFNLSSPQKYELECFVFPSIDTAPLDWNSLGIFILNGHAYSRFIKENKSWSYAKSFCEALGGHLAFIKSSDVHDFLVEHFINGIDYDLWVGAYKDNGIWKWLDGDTFDYSNFIDEPQNYNFLELLIDYNGKWDADPDEGNNNLGFICEWDNLRDAALFAYGYRFFNGHSFKLLHSNNLISWLSAKASCDILGGHLATSTSYDKNSFLYLIKDNHTVWLGATDEDDEGNWRWVTGENWNFSHWEEEQPNNAENIQHFLAMQSDSDYWNDLEDSGALSNEVHYFICEWDYDFRPLGFIPGNIFNFNDALSLAIAHDGTLRMRSDAWNIEASSTSTVSPDSQQHLMLRFRDSFAYVYLNGQLVFSAPCSGSDISPDSFSLGGFSGFIDEFIFRHYASEGTPIIPDRPYEIILRHNSAPVTFATWSASNLPDGLSLSSSGLLEGTPTTAGSFISNVSVNTNWGTHSINLRFVIQ